LENTRKRVLEVENENSNYWNKLSNFHKCLTKIGKTLGSINSKHVKFKQALEQE
jgi:hypothetical protein